jgi:hypothetical protein
MNVRARLLCSVVLLTTFTILPLLGCGDDDAAAPGCKPEWSDVTFTVVREPGGEVAPLFAIWGPSEGNFLAVGGDGTLLFDGSTWHAVAGEEDWDFGALLWGPSINDVYAVSELEWTDHVLHFDGATWTEEPIPAEALVWGLWGTSSSDVYAVGLERVDSVDAAVRPTRSPGGVGTRGVVLHFDGSGWKKVSEVVDSEFFSIHGRSPEDVYVVGDRGLILHYDGTAWTEQESGVENRLRYVCAGDDGVVFAIGFDGSVLALEGAGWTLRSPAVGQDVFLLSVWGTSVSDVWAVKGGGLEYYDGTEWSSVDVPYGIHSPVVWGYTPGEPYLLGHSGAVLHRAEEEWVLVREGSRADLVGVDGRSGERVVAAGWSGYGRLLSLENGEWRPLRSSFSAYLSDICCEPGGTALLAGGTGERPFLARLSGEEVDTTLTDPNGALESFGSLRAVWSAPSGGFVAVGADDNGALICRSASGGVVADPLGADIQDLFGVWGVTWNAVFAVGSHGEIVHWDGTAWSSMESGTETKLDDVGGLSGEDVFAVGAGGTILHYDGSTWAAQESGTSADLFGIWGSPSAGMVAVGRDGTVLHYDGCVWSLCTPATTRDLRGVWGSDEDGIFAVGEDGIILWSPPPAPPAKSPCAD